MVHAERSNLLCRHAREIVHVGAAFLAVAHFFIA